jgi:hypothetical protein
VGYHDSRHFYPQFYKIETIQRGFYSESNFYQYPGPGGKTKDLLSSVPDGIYSENIRQEQLKEIDFLMDHYGRLFEAEGNDYAALIRIAYASRAKYAAFLSQLRAVEKDVMTAAQRTLGAQADLQAASRLEELTDKVRAAEIEKIFPTGLSQQNVN